VPEIKYNKRASASKVRVYFLLETPTFFSVEDYLGNYNSSSAWKSIAGERESEKV